MRRYYKITPDSEKNLKLQRFLHSCYNAEDVAENYARKFGAVAFHTHPSALAGGVAYLEFDNPDERTWRKVTVLDGQDCYEPNVMQLEGVMIAKDKFRPSDTAHKIFTKLPRTWNQVRPLKTLQEWANMIGYTLTEDKEQDARFVHTHLKDTMFWHFIEFVGIGLKQKRTPVYVKRAITAAVEMYKLPVVFPDTLYNIIGASLAEEADEECGTPQFFYWESKREWYVALDCTIEGEDTDEITEQTFIYAMNTALRESEQTRVSCLDD